MEGGAHVARASTPRAHSLGARPSKPRLGSGVPSAVSRAARTAAARRQGPSPAGKSVRDRRMVGRMRAYPLVVVTFSTLVMACAGQALPGPRADIAARSYRMPESTRSRWRRDGRHLRLGHGQSDGGAERVCLRGVAHGAFRGPSPVRNPRVPGVRDRRGAEPRSLDVIATADGKRLTAITSEAKADIPSSASTPIRVERHRRTHDNVDRRRGGARRPRSRRPAKRARADAGSARRDSMAS